MLSWLKWPVVERIHPPRNQFGTSVESEATGDLKLNDSPGQMKQSKSSRIQIIENKNINEEQN